MPEKRELLNARLDKTRQQLEEARRRVAELEAELTEATGAQSDSTDAVATDAPSDRSDNHTAKAAQVNGQRWRTFVEHAPAAIAMLDKEMRYLLVSQRWLADYRLSESNVIGRSHYDIFPDIPARWRDIHQRCLQGAVESSEIEEFPRIDGSVDWVRWEIRPWRLDTGEIGGIFIFTEVVTAQKLAQDELLALYEATSHLFAGNTMADLGQQITETVVRTFDQVDCGLMLFDKKQNTITRLNRTGTYEVHPERPLEVAGLGLVPKAIRSGEMVYVPDVTLSPDYLPNEARTRSELVIPLKTAQGVIGVLDLQHIKTDAFSARDRRVLTAYSERAAAAIETMQLVDELNRHAQKLEQRVARGTTDLKHARLRVDAIFNNSLDGMLLIGSDLSIQQTNASFHRLVLCQPNDCKGKSLLDLIYPEDHSKIESFLKTLVADKRGDNIESRAVRKDGTIFDAELSFGFIIGDGLTCVIRDITERKRQERQLRYHASVQQNMSDAVIVTDMALHIQSWNKAAERIYGWGESEVLGRIANEIVRSEFSTPEGREQTLEKLRVRGWSQAEVVQYRRDGSPINILGSVTIVHDDNGQPLGIVSVNRDITERKQVEEALQQTSLDYQDLYNNAPCGYHSLDTHGVFIQINDTELRWLGYKREEVVGKLNIRDIFTPDSVAIFQENFPIFKERGWLNELEVEITRKDGTVIPVLLNATAVYDADGNFLKSRTTLFDITESKTIQNELTASEERFRWLAENITDLIVKLDPDGIRTFATPSCYPLLGYSPEELIGKSRTAIVHPDDVAASNAAFEEAIQRSKPSFLLTQRMRHKDGHYLWVEVVTTIVRGPETGAVQEFIGVIRDITERKRIEDALHESDELFRQIAENFDQMLFIRSGDNTQTLYINPAVETITGVSREERLVNPDAFLECVYPDDVERLRQQQLSRDYLETGFSNLEYRFIHPDQEIRWARLRTFPIKDEHGTIVRRIGISEDITERKQAEEVLKAKLVEERTFQDYLKALHDITIELTQTNELADFYRRTVELGRERFGIERMGMYLYDPETGEAQGTFGTDAQGNVINEQFIRYVPSPTGIMINALSRKERIYCNENATLFADTKPIGTGWNAAGVLWNGTECLGWLVIDNLFSQQPIPKLRLDALGLYALTIGTLLAQKQSQIALRDSEMKYRSLVETMRGGLIIFDSEGKISYINGRFEEMLGYSREEVMGTLPTAYVVEDYLPVLLSNVGRRRLLESSTYELPFRHKNGHTVHVLVSGTPLVTRDGKYNGSFAVMTDISVQKQAEDALRIALAKEKELGELKTRFVSMASHEFRTPLATILTLTETLSFYRQKMTEEKIDERLDKIKDQVDHLKNIMEDVLMLARMQSRRVEFNPRTLALDLLCRSVLEEYESMSTITHELRYVCTGQPRDIMVDPMLMRRIISNLVSNAIKYSPTASTVNIKLEYTETEVVFQVSDEGIGIPEPDLAHLFEAFHRSANVGTISGTGLGLAITKESVERHGGTITVESQIGVGTTFTVRIPIEGVTKVD